MQLEKDQREAWTGPDNCPMFNRDQRYCFSKAKPYSFCLFCPANEERIRSANQPKPYISLQSCFNFDIEKDECMLCRKKRSGSNKICYKKSKFSKVHNLKKRRIKRKRTFKHQRAIPDWRDFMDRINRRGKYKKNQPKND